MLCQNFKDFNFETTTNSVSTKITFKTFFDFTQKIRFNLPKLPALKRFSKLCTGYSCANYLIFLFVMFCILFEIF